MTTIDIPNSVTSIGSCAFWHCKGLTNINIPNSVTSIGKSAFTDCSALTSVNIPNSVTSIGEYAFSGCSQLTSVNIGNSVTSIGNYAFSSCNQLTNVTCLSIIPPTIYLYSFTSIVTHQATLYVPQKTVPAYQAANYWSYFTQIVGLMEGTDFEVDGIYYKALNENTAMVTQNPKEENNYHGDVVIPNFVTYFDILFRVTDIDANAFDGCYELNSVVIGDAVETIGKEAFQGCTGLTSVTIGSGVANIGERAFNYCNALQSVTCLGTEPPVMANSNCFSSAAYRKATLKVHRNYIDTYTASDYWYMFNNIEGFGSLGPGDVNADGKINIADVTALINLMLSGGEYNPYGDFNNNSKIDIGDVTTLIDYLLTSN